MSHGLRKSDVTLRAQKLGLLYSGDRSIRIYTQLFHPPSHLFTMLKSTGVSKGKGLDLA